MPKLKSRPACLPAQSSPIWAEKSKPLFHFLEQEPRNWCELVVWAKCKKVGGYLLRNYLAYLEETYRAEAVACQSRSSGKYLWVWRVAGHRKPLFADYKEVPPEEIYRYLRENGGMLVDDSDIDEGEESLLE